MHIYIYIYTYILVQTLFPVRLLQNIEEKSLCYTPGPCWLSILNMKMKVLVAQSGSLQPHGR